MLKRLLNILKLNLVKKEKSLDEILDEFATFKNFPEETTITEIERNYLWNSNLGHFVDIILEVNNQFYFLFQNEADAEMIHGYIALNNSFKNKNIFLYSLNKDGKFIEKGYKESSTIIQNKSKKDKEDYTKMFKFIETNSDSLLEIVNEDYVSGKKNNPVRRAESKLNHFLLDYLKKEFKNAKLFYRGISKKEEKDLIGTKDDLILLNSLSGRNNFKEGIDHFSLVIGRAVYSHHSKNHHLKSGIVFNLTNGNYYCADPYSNTKFFNGDEIKDFFPKQIAIFMDTTPIKIFMKNKLINEDYQKQNHYFFNYLNNLKNGKFNKTIVDELSLALNMVEDSNFYPVIIAPQFPVWNAPVAYLLERMGYDTTINYHCIIDTNNLNLKPLIYTHRALQENFQNKMHSLKNKK